jgi:inosine-uridine nucleoside N-ribohydrolase
MVVFDNFTDITMVPIEACRVFREMPASIVEKPFIQTQTVKGKLVHDSFRVAFKNLRGHYETNDPLAVAIAFDPSLALETIEKCCYIESTGAYTKGMVVVDWFEIYK